PGPDGASPPSGAGTSSTPEPPSAGQASSPPAATGPAHPENPSGPLAHDLRPTREDLDKCRSIRSDAALRRPGRRPQAVPPEAQYTAGASGVPRASEMLAARRTTLVMTARASGP